MHLNPMSPGYARFIQANNEIQQAPDIEELLEAYLFHRIRHEHEEQGYFAVMLDRAAAERALQLGVSPRRTRSMNRDQYEIAVLEDLIDRGRYNRWYVVEDGQLLSDIQGHPSVSNAVEELSGMQIDMFGGGPQVYSARALVRHYLGVHDVP